MKHNVKFLVCEFEDRSDQVDVLKGSKGHIKMFLGR
jgi:hypothetical protein